MLVAPSTAEAGGVVRPPVQALSPHGQMAPCWTTQGSMAWARGGSEPRREKVPLGHEEARDLMSALGSRERVPFVHERASLGHLEARGLVRALGSREGAVCALGSVAWTPGGSRPRESNRPAQPSELAKKPRDGLNGRCP